MIARAVLPSLIAAQQGSCAQGQHLHAQQHTRRLNVVHSARSAGSLVLIALRASVISLCRTSTHACSLVVETG